MQCPFWPGCLCLDDGDWCQSERERMNDGRAPEEEDGEDDWEACGRWDNATLARHCWRAGTEDCVFCPFGR